MSHKKKIIIGVSVAAFAVAVTAVVILVKYVSAKETVSYNETVPIEVSAPAIVQRDNNGIPLVQAANMEDALMILGYLHAQDRVIIAEYYRALARGTLSSIVGEDALVMDKLSRTLNFTGEAEKIFRSLDKKYLGYLNAYVKGINYFLKKSFSDIASVSRLSSDEWNAQDAIAILLMLDWYSSFLNNREHVFMIHKQLLTREVQKVFPPSLTFSYDDADRNNVVLIKELQRSVRKYVGAFNRGLAFYVPSENTADEKSAHGFSLESLGSVYPLWYPARFKVNGKSIAGITAVGMPYIFDGKNDIFSFSGFNLSLDVQDFYRETTRKGARAMECLLRGKWVELSSREENIEVLKENGQFETLQYQVRSKEDCPIISDVFKGKIPSDVLSVRGINPSKDYLKFLFELPFAENTEQAMRLAANIVAVPKVYLLAAHDNASVMFFGAVPNRAPGNTIFQRGEYYAGYIPLIMLSAYSRKERYGHVVIGSEMLANLPLNLHQYKVFNDAWRFERLDELIRTRASQPQSISEILHDQESQIAKRFAPLYHSLLEKIPIPSAKLTRIYFKNWDYNADRNSVPAALMHVVLHKFFLETVRDELKDESYHVSNYMYWTLDKFAEISKDENALIFDDTSSDVRMETRSMIFDRAFLAALKHLNEHAGPFMKDWKWGYVHKAKLAVPLLRKKSFVRKEFMKTYLYRMGGDDSTVLNASVNINDRYRANSLTAISACFYGGSFLSTATGMSINPLSEFNQFYMDKRQFSDFESSVFKYEMKFIPRK